MESDEVVRTPDREEVNFEEREKFSSPLSSIISSPIEIPGLMLGTPHTANLVSGAGDCPGSGSCTAQEFFQLVNLQRGCLVLTYRAAKLISVIGMGGSDTRSADLGSLFGCTVLHSF
jgi:hypothetical protein